MAPARYFELIREMRDAYNHRLRLVASVRKRGIKPTARLFATSTLTVRKWWRRYQQQGPSGLIEHSRRPQHSPQKTPLTVEQQVLALRRRLPTFGAARLKREFDLPVSHMAIQRIWRQHGLIAKRRRKYQRKQDLAAIKATWRLFQQISADTKDLCDIPQFWPQAQQLELPAVQYTAREVRSGLLFWAFAQRRSAAVSAVFAARIQQHLGRCGISLRDLAWQTDNGVEFIGSYDRRVAAPAFRRRSAIASICVFPPPPTLIRVTWKPCTGWSRMNSSIWKPSPVAATSWPRPSLISSISIWCGPTRTKKI